MNRVAGVLRRHPVAALVLLAFILRLAFWAHLATRAQGPLVDDYSVIAVKWLKGQELNTIEKFFRPPLYAWYLYALFLVAGPKAWLAQWLGCAMAAAGCLVLHRTASALGHPGAGIGAAAIWSVNVFSIYFSGQLMSETLYVPMTMLFFWLWLEASKRDDWRLGAAVGLIAGLSCLCRWVFFGYLPLFGLAEGAGALRRRRGFKALAAVVIVSAVVLGAWLLRNQNRYGRWILAGPQKGWNFYEGLDLQLREDFERPKRMEEEAERLGIADDPFKTDEHFWRKGWAEVRDDPKSSALLFTGKFFKFWRLAPYPPHPRAMRWAAGAFYLVLFTLALHGALIARAQGVRLLPLYLYVVYLHLLHTVFFSGIRYRYPLDPFLSLMAGFSLYALWETRLKRLPVFRRFS